MQDHASAAVRLLLQGGTFASVENWRRSQSKIPSRSKAVRELLERALSSLSANNTKQTASCGPPRSPQQARRASARRLCSERPRYDH